MFQKQFYGKNFVIHIEPIENFVLLVKRVLLDSVIAQFLSLMVFIDLFWPYNDQDLVSKRSPTEDPQQKNLSEIQRNKISVERFSRRQRLHADEYTVGIANHRGNEVYIHLRGHTILIYSRSPSINRCWWCILHTVSSKWAIFLRYSTLKQYHFWLPMVRDWM